VNEHGSILSAVVREGNLLHGFEEVRCQKDKTRKRPSMAPNAARGRRPHAPSHSWALENQSEPELHHSLVTVIVIDAGYGPKSAVGDSRIKLVRNRMV